MLFSRLSDQQATDPDPKSTDCSSLIAGTLVQLKAIRENSLTNSMLSVVMASEDVSVGFFEG